MIVQASPDMFAALMQLDRMPQTASERLAMALKDITDNPINDRTLRLDQQKDA